MFQVESDDTTCTEAFETEIKNDTVINQDVRTMSKRKYVLAKGVYRRLKPSQPLPNKNHITFPNALPLQCPSCPCSLKRFKQIFLSYVNVNHVHRCELRTPTAACQPNKPSTHPPQPWRKLRGRRTAWRCSGTGCHQAQPCARCCGCHQRSQTRQAASAQGP